ncbi:MAG: SUMF1/EgtB/PvdO family nonheme iron enzyme [Clostridia bacterium]|jgi:formylglycine-generating enzyme|nr:SUMF1/EgtB/PvdO family nonheme iron enzyme [Clostridia bacterium]
MRNKKEKKKKSTSHIVWIIVACALFVSTICIAFFAYIEPRLPGGPPHFDLAEAENRQQLYDRHDDFELLDINDDNYLSVDEYYGLQKMFDDMDVNGDGLLSWEEAKYMMTFVEIEAGTFTFGTDEEFAAFKDPPGDQGPASEIYLDTYLMAKTELTIAQYVMYLNSALEAGQIDVVLGDMMIADKRFNRAVPTWEIHGAEGTTYEGMVFTKLVQMGALSHNANEVSGKLIPESPYNQSWINYHEPTNSFYSDPGMEEMPAAYMYWWGAMAFAEYYELSVPTEAEWEKAAKGGLDYDYATVDGTNAADVLNYGCYNAQNSLFYSGVDTPEEYVGFRLPVGCYEPNPYGVYDMSGNVWEWTMDWYNTDFHQYLIDEGITKNPLSLVGDIGIEPTQYFMGDEVKGGPSVPLSHDSIVTRGGSYNYGGGVQRTEWRMPTYQFIGNDHFGTRFVIRPATTEFNEKE